MAATLAKLETEADGEAAKYGNDIVFMAEFANAKNQFMGWITVSLAVSIGPLAASIGTEM